MAGGSLAPSQAGAPPSRQKRKAQDSALASAAGEDEADDEEEGIEELEREVADLGRRILEHRRDAATRLLDAAVSRFATLRPSTCLEGRTEPQSVAGISLVEIDQEMLEKLKIFKSTTEANIAAMPKVLKKMNECVAQMERLEQLNVNVHPVFQRKRQQL